MLGLGLEEQEAPSTLGLKVEGGLAGQQDGESHLQEPRAVVRGCSQSEVVARLRVGGGGMDMLAQLSFLLPVHIHNSGVPQGSLQTVGGVSRALPHVFVHRIF